MKTDLLKRKKGWTGPSPFFKIFALLAIMLVGVNGAWAQTSYGKAEINGAPGSSTGLQTIKDQGDVKAWYNGTATEFTNGAKEIGGKWYVKLSGDGFIKIRVAKGSVVAGDILRVETIDIYQNGDQQNLGFKVKGSGGIVTLKENDNAVHTLDYILKADDIDVDPEDSDFDYIQFDRNGNSGCGYHSVEILRDRLDAFNYKTWSDINGNTFTNVATGGAITTSLPATVDAGGTVYGDGNVYYLNYVNVKGGSGAIMPDAKYLIIEGNSGVVVRILFNRVSDGGSNEEKNLTIPSDGKLIFDISSYDTFHLNAIKIPWNGSTGNVVNTIKLSNSLAGYTVGIKLDGLPSDCDAWFTLNGEATQYRTAQANVPVGTTVTYTMTSSDPHHSPNGWRTAAWADPDLGWMGPSAGFGSSAASFTTTVRAAAEGTANNEQRLFGDLNPWPEYTNNFMVYARAGEGGTATVTDAEGHDMSTGYNCSEWAPNQGKTGSLTFTATAAPGYTFDGWYNTSDTKVSPEATYNYGVYSSVNTAVDLTLTAKFIASSEGTADFTDRGKGSGVESWSGGTLTTNKTSDNWANIFVFSGDGQNVTKTADKFSGLTIDALGNNFRLLVYYEGGAVAIKAQDCTNTKTTYRYSWTDLGVPFDKISTITRVCVAGNQQGNATTTFSDARLLAEFHTVHFNGLPDGTSGKEAVAEYSVEGKKNSWDGDRFYVVSSVSNVMEGTPVTFYGSVKDEYKNTHLIYWESDNAGIAFNNNFEFKMGAQDVNVTLKIVEGAQMHAGFVDNSAQPAGNGICFMQGGWNRGADALVYTGTGITVTATAVDGYDFLGWYSNADGAEGNRLTTNLTLDANTAAGAHNYYAFYRKQGQVTLTYALNGGTGTLPASVTVNAGETISQIASNNDAVIKGADRAKWWNTKPDGTGICYAPSDKDDSDAKTSIVMNDDVTLYPFWRTNPIYSASPVVVETGTTSLTYKYKVTGDGYASITLQKNDGNGNWTDCAGNKDGDFTVTSDIRDQKLPGWEVEVTVELTNIPNTDSSDLYRLKLGHYSGHKYQYNDTYVGIYLGKPAGYHAINVTFDGQTKEREFLVHVPNGATEAVPVLFSLHGAGNDYDSGVAKYNDLANQEKFIVVYPRGNYHNIPPIGDNVRGWLSTGKYNEDVKFFEDVIDWLNSHYRIKTDQVYMTGFSNGGMMCYSTAFTSDRFAGFAAVSGYPLNQFHLQHYGNGEWQGSHPVPFMHIHGTADTNNPYGDIQPIIDNMIYRNGCSFVPSTTNYDACDAADGKPAAFGGKKEEFSSTTGAPFVYYSVTSMGHQPDCHINISNGASWDNASQGIIWNFLKDKKRINMSDYNGRNRNEFLPQLEVAGDDFHTSHGWKRDVDNNILWQYGDKPTEALDGSHHQNVYHTIQLGKGYHNFSFTSSSDAAIQTTMWVNVIVEKLGKLGQNGCASTYTEDYKELINRNYNIGEVSFNINQEESDICEYRLTFKWGNSDETDGGKNDGKDIKISNVQIVNNTGTDKGFIHGETTQSDFKGYFNYENRLIAQWNFDLCDGARFNETEIAKNSSTWDVSGPVNGKTTYTYKPSTNGEFIELTYGNAAKTKIPISAGLKFKAEANQIQVVVTKDNSGNVTNTQLVLASGVQMYVPYVRNSYRADDGSAKSAYEWKDTNVDNWPEANRPVDKDGNVKTGWQTYWNDFHADRFYEYQDCLHHINRDIVYIVSSPNIWGAGVMTNKCHNNAEKDLFNTGGQEDVKGSTTKKTWEKLNFLGDQGEDCIITFTSQIVIDRLGVNRNLVYSYYTENIAATTDGAYTKPVPGLRIIGSPRGAKVADVGDTYATYVNAIAMTYGGWAYNNGSYQKKDDGSTVGVNDQWGDLTVYHGEGQGTGSHNYNSDDYTTIDVTKVPLATDGFPVYSRQTSYAYSETLNPAIHDNALSGNRHYHDESDGTFIFHPADRKTGDTNERAYIENLNPWSLPCRGAYVKYEPTLPGVLNVHIVQKGGEDYVIADEYGRLIKKNVFFKTGTGQTMANDNGHYSITNTDNVKYSFDVHPGKTYYIFSNTSDMGVTGFNFEPYVYRLYNTLDAAKDAGFSGEDAAEEYELARQDVGIKTATMTAGPTYAFEDNNQVFEWTNQTAEYHGSDQTNVEPSNGEQKLDASGNPDVKTWESIERSTVASYPTSKATGTNINPIKYYDNAVHVIYNREFEANKWATICLPYSMNNLQLQTVFGDDVKVVLLRDVQERGKNGYTKRTANFIYHMNQDILAGYPYLIYPSKHVGRVESNTVLFEDEADGVEHKADNKNTLTAPKIININGVGQNTVTHPGGASVDRDTYYKYTPAYNYDGMSDYEYVGTFTDNNLAPYGSYVVSKNNGTLTLINNESGATVNAFRAYLKFVGDKANAAKGRIEAVNFGDVEGEFDEALAIEDVLLESGIVGGNTNVYNVNGQLVRQNTDDLSGLAKGIYIVNGKKYIVK